jgi:hypothetical protein
LLLDRAIPPATPYLRLMNSKHVPEKKKRELTELYNDIDPFELKEQIRKKLDQIFRLINKNGGEKMCYI